MSKSTFLTKKTSHVPFAVPTGGTRDPLPHTARLLGPVQGIPLTRGEQASTVGEVALRITTNSTRLASHATIMPTKVKTIGEAGDIVQERRQRTGVAALATATAVAEVRLAIYPWNLP